MLICSPRKYSNYITRKKLVSHESKERVIEINSILNENKREGTL